MEKKNPFAEKEQELKEKEIDQKIYDKKQHGTYLMHTGYCDNCGAYIPANGMTIKRFCNKTCKKEFKGRK